MCTSPGQTFFWGSVLMCQMLLSGFPFVKQAFTATVEAKSQFDEIVKFVHELYFAIRPQRQPLYEAAGCVKKQK